MWVSTTGIIVQKIQYAEQKFILHIITADHGFGSFSLMMPKTRNATRLRHILNYPMAIVQFRYVDHSQQLIRSLKDLYIDYSYMSIPVQSHKLLLVMFINEVVAKTALKFAIDRNGYIFFRSILTYIDKTDDNLQNYPIWFLLHYFRLIGIGPSLPQDAAAIYFDFSAGKFISPKEKTTYVLDADTSHIIKEYLSQNYNPNIVLSTSQRQSLLALLVQFMNFHTSEQIFFESIQYL